MMYIIFGKREIVWHCGKKLPGGTPANNEVTEIQADGAELTWIRANFENLPVAKTPVCNWFGDMAKMIAARIPRAD